jgi:hypothetical protein
MNIFISHSTSDQRDFDLAHKLAESLQAAGTNVWIAPEYIPSGDVWEETLVNEILKKCTHFLIILSASSVKSQWVLKEISIARERYQKEGSLKILPLKMGKLPEYEFTEFINKFQAIPYSNLFSSQLDIVLKELDLPPVVPARFRTLINETTRYFTGRENVFAAIQKFITNQNKGCFEIVGDPGEGKTTIIAEYVRRTGSPAHFNIAPEGINTTALFLESLKMQLKLRLDIDIPLRHGEISSASLQIMELLDKASVLKKPNEPLVIAIDALDEVKIEDESGSLNILSLPQMLPDGIFLLLSRRRKQIRFVTREPIDIYDLIDHPSLNRIDTERYLTKRLAEPVFQAWLKKNDCSLEKACMDLADRSENNFMYLHYVLGDIANRGPLLSIEELPSGLKGYYKYHWTRMGMDRLSATDIKLKVIYILSHLTQQISVPSLSQMLKVTPTEIRSTIKDWQEFLHIIKLNDENYYRLYHYSFQEFLQKKEEVEDLKMYYTGLITDYYASLLYK